MFGKYVTIKEKCINYKNNHKNIIFYNIWVIYHIINNDVAMYNLSSYYNYYK